MSIFSKVNAFTSDELIEQMENVDTIEEIFEKLKNI